MARRYGEDFKRQAVELMIHSGKTQRQVARELDVSDLQFNPLEKGLPGPAEAGRDRGADEEPGGDGKDHSGATQRDRVSEAPAGDLISGAVKRGIAGFGELFPLAGIYKGRQ